MSAFSKRNDYGEIILIILLVMAVGLTIGLAVASRSITDIRLTSQIEESSRAFSAAEAGIEEVLKTGISGATSISGTTTGGNASYNVQLSALDQNGVYYNFPSEIAEGDTQTIWLVNQKADGTGPDDSTRAFGAQSMFICWSNLGTMPALDVSLLFRDISENVYKVAREPLDPGTSYASDNGFRTSGIINNSNTCDNGSYDYTYSTAINFVSMDNTVNYQDSDAVPIAIRIKPVYAPTKVGIRVGGGVDIPEQGKNITSVGETSSGVVRKWNVVQTYSSPNDIFDYTIWSQENISK